MRLHKLTCPNCNGTLDMKVTEGTTSVFCPYCGQQFYLDDEHQRFTYNKNVTINKNIHKRYTDDADVIRATHEANKDSKDFKQFLILWGLLALIPILIFGGLFLNKAVNQGSGKINAGYYRDLVGDDYKTVEAHFKAAGFTNIELIDLDDAGIGFWRNGKVKTISVGGNTQFESTDWFDPDTKVVISYH